MDTAPCEWAPERAASIESDVRRLFWRRTGPSLAVFVAGWAVLILVLVLALDLPPLVAGVAAVGCLCAVLAGLLRLSWLPVRQLSPIFGFGVVIGVQMLVGAMTAIWVVQLVGVVGLGVMSLVCLGLCARSYRRLVR